VQKADMTERTATGKMSVHDRVVSVLEGHKPDHLPFIGRLHVWHTCHRRAGTLPREFETAAVEDIHRAVGIGCQRFVAPYVWRLRGVEMAVSFNGQEIYREKDPIVDLFCGVHDKVSMEKAGETVTEYITPVGTLRTRHELAALGITTGTEPYLKEHLIKEEGDYHTVEYLLEHAEYLPQYDRILTEEQQVGNIGFVIPMPPRVPFQQVLLEYVGEVPAFYALHDSPRQIERLMHILDEQLTEILRHMTNLHAVYVEFPDNLHGLMTNPSLFKKYSLPYYQRYCDMLHGQGKKVGSHTDGNVKPLLGLLKESGLDVCESFSPAPLTECTFDEAWQTWRGGPIIWGGIPSPLLEERTGEEEFRDYLEHILAMVNDQAIILCVVDMVMGHNSLERIRYIADRLEQHSIA
jgi:hypothetical protein